MSKNVLPPHEITQALKPGAFLQHLSDMTNGLFPQHEREPFRCPACGGANAPDAVFCQNLQCHKALGEFTYVHEGLLTETRWHKVLADKVTAFMTQPHFVAVHVLWFTIWIALNLGALALFGIFDEYPFFLLVTILAIETLFLTIFVLISNNRQTVHINKRAELDYEVSVRTYRTINEIHTIVHALVERLDKERSPDRGDVHEELQDATITSAATA
jgi:uncharacterized membrane protein